MGQLGPHHQLHQVIYRGLHGVNDLTVFVDDPPVAHGYKESKSRRAAVLGIQEEIVPLHEHSTPEPYILSPPQFNPGQGFWRPAVFRDSRWIFQAM